MPGDKETIEQFAARIKAKYPQYKDVNDTDLVNRIVAKHPQYKDSVDFGGQTQTTTPQYSGGPKGSVIPDYAPANQRQRTDSRVTQPIVQPLPDKVQTVAEKHAEEVGAAQQRINSTLQKSDPAIKSLLMDYKKQRAMGEVQNDIQQRGVDATGHADLTQRISSLIPKASIHVSDDEVKDYKRAMETDPNLAREALYEHSKLNPADAKTIAADTYLLDSKDRSHNAEKILKNKQGIEKGDLDYSIWHGGQIKKPEGFVQSLGRGFDQRQQQFNDYDFLSSAKDEDIVAEMEKRRTTQPNEDDPVPVAEGLKGGFGQMLGAEGPTMAKGALPGILSAVTGGGAAAAAPWLGALLTSPDFYERGYANSFNRHYNELRDEGHEPSEALQIAKNRASFDAKADVAQGAVMTAAGVKMGMPATQAKFSNGFLGAVKSAAKELAASTPEAAAQGGLGGLTQVVKNVHAGKDVGEGTVDAALLPIAFHYGIGIIAKGVHLTNPELYKSAVDNMAKQPEEMVNKTIGEQVESGEITPEQANDVHLVIEDQRAQHQELLNKAKEIVAKGKVEGKEAEPMQHDALNNPEEFTAKLQEIAEKAHKGDNELLSEKYGDDLINVAKQLFPKEPAKLKMKTAAPDETTQTDEAGPTGTAPSEPVPFSNQQLEAAKGFLQQGLESGGIDPEYGPFLEHSDHLLNYIKDQVKEGKGAEMKTEFGDALVALSQSENSYPIGRNIKLKDNATQEQSAGALDVGESPANGGALGEGHPGPEIPAGESQPEAQSQSTSQEEGLDPYGLPFKDEPGDKRTGIKNAISYATRFEMKLPKVDVPKLGTDTEVLNQGKELVESGKVNPHEVIDRVLATNEGMHPDEAKAMQYYMHQLGAHEQALHEQLADSPDELSKAYTNSQLQQLSDEIDAATEANIKSGKAWSDVGNIRQIVVDPAFNASREKSLIKEAYGGKLPPGVQERIDTFVKQRDAAIEARLKAEERLKNAAATKTLQKIKEVVEKEEKAPKTKKATKEDILKEREQLIEDLKKAWKEDRSQLGAIPLPTQTIGVIGKLAVNYFREGYVNLEELTGKVFDDIKMHIPGISKKDVRDAISQYDPLRGEAKATSQQKLVSKEARIQKQLATGNILPKKTNPFLNFEKDTEWQKASQRAINAEYKLKVEKRKAFESKKNMYQKGLMWAGRGFRLSVLSGYNVLGKLAAAATIGGAVKRIPEQAIGAIYSQIFKGVSRKAPIEGSPNLSAELKFYKEFFDPKKFGKNSLEILKSGASPLSKKFGGAEHEHIPVLYLPTDLHQIIKDPLKRGTFEASFKNAMSWAEKQGLDITDPLVIQSMETASYKRAQYEIFQEQNWLSKKFSEFKTNMEKKGNIGATGKFVADFLIPVSTVPTNIARRLTTTSPLGLIRGGAKVVEAYRKGIENLSNEQADAVMKQLKQGSLGTALWMIGWFGASHFGGLYSKFNPDKKRKEGELPSDEMEINGEMIPKPVQHALPLEIIQVAATMKHIHDNYADHLGKSEFESDYAAALGSIGALAEQIPVIETGAHAIGALSNPYEAGKLQEDVKRRFEPQILRETGIIKKEPKAVAAPKKKGRTKKREHRT